MGTSSSSSLFPRFLFGALLLVGLVCLVVVGGTREPATLSTHHSAEIVKQDLVKGRDNKPVERVELDYYNYMSKRAVPNGPDPIHNRRAGNSGRPPGQA